MTSASFNVPIIDDNVLESDEHIFLRIDSSSLPSRFIVTDPSQATLTIVNDDCKLLPSYELQIQANYFCFCSCCGEV